MAPWIKDLSRPVTLRSVPRHLYPAGVNLAWVLGRAPVWVDGVWVWWGVAPQQA